MTQIQYLCLTFVLSAVLLNSVSCHDFENKKALDVLTLTSDFLKKAFVSGIADYSGNGTFSTHETDNMLCTQQLAYLWKNKLRKDVFPFFDSWGRLPSGLLYGHIQSLGNFDQCVEIRTKLSSGGEVQGKYCKAVVPVTNVPEKSTKHLKSPLPWHERDVETRAEGVEFKLRIGVCIPASCREELASKFLSQATEVDVRLTDCHTNDRVDFTTMDIVAITLLSTIGALMLLSSMYDYVTKGSPKTPLFLTFSIITHSRKLFKISSSTKPSSITCLDGIRVFSMIWVIYGHGHAALIMLPLTNIIKVFEWHETFYGLTLVYAQVSVDTFFFISGMLIAWMGLKQMTKSKGKLNVPKMYIHRFVRIIPPLAVIVLFAATIFAYLGTGPLWSISKSGIVDGCVANWWRTLLFVQNYTKTDNMCLEFTWFLAVDMQMYIVSPLFLFGLYKWGRKFLPVLVILCLLSAACTFATFYVNDFKGLVYDPARFSSIYIPTHIRYTPWMIGLGFGYLMFEVKDHKVIMRKSTLIIGWVASLATLCAVIYGPYPTMQPGYQPGILSAAIYTHFSKFGWSLALCWIIFACHNGYGGQINAILSYTFWQVLVRLSYAMYLTHVFAWAVMYGNVRTDMHFSNFDMSLLFWPAFGITFIASVLLVLVIESPTIALEQLLLKKDKKDTSNDVVMTVTEEELTVKMDQNSMQA